MNNIRFVSYDSWEFGIGPGCICIIIKRTIYILIPLLEFTIYQTTF